MPSIDIHNLEQGSDAWRIFRSGKVTASRIADLTARTKNGYGASRANYMAQLIAERLTGVPQETYSNAAMQWGTETEPLARAAYEFRNDVEVAEVGFIPHPAIPDSGASPDGLVGDDGLVEIKAPNPATHIETLLTTTVPEKYIKQMQWQMACTGRDWCDFCSFDPRMPAKLQIFTRRVMRDPGMIAELESEVTKFLSEMEEKLDQLRNLAA